MNHHPTGIFVYRTLRLCQPFARSVLLIRSVALALVIRNLFGYWLLRFGESGLRSGGFGIQRRRSRHRRHDRSGLLRFGSGIARSGVILGIRVLLRHGSLWCGGIELVIWSAVRFLLRDSWGVVSLCGRHRRISSWNVVRSVKANSGGIALRRHEYDVDDIRDEYDRKADENKRHTEQRTLLGNSARVAVRRGCAIQSELDGACAEQNGTGYRDYGAEGHNAVVDGEQPAWLVGVMQTADGYRQRRNESRDGENITDDIGDVLHGVPGAGSEQTEHIRQQTEYHIDDEHPQNPPPEFATGCAALERGVFLPEADESLTHSAAVGRLVERRGQGEEAGRPHRSALGRGGIWILRIVWVGIHVSYLY